MKVGYKKSDLGMIPADWSTCTLKKCCKKITDGTHDTPKTVSSGIPFLTAIHVKENKVNYEECLYISKSDHSIVFSRCNPERNDILIVNIGAGVGTSALVTVDYEFSLKNVALLKPDSRLATGAYVNYSLSAKKSKIIQDLSNGGAQPFLSLTHLGKVEIPLPPTKTEQEAIAGALSDADALIESLEQLLTKKRQIKQGAMQELLTGKRRLPGFKTTWHSQKLSVLADIRSGGTPSSTVVQYWNGDVPWCTPTDITALNGHKYLSQTQRTITKQGLDSSSAELIPENSVIMTSRATIGECAITVVPLATNQGFKNFVPYSSVEHEFLYYLLLSKKQDFISLCGGSTFLEIGKTQLSAFEVTLPQEKAEQTAIAAVLGDMDTEISTLEEKLTKAKAIKQGMMQELLTGRIRLV